MEWSTYIRRLGQVAGDSTQAEIADRTGMGQETISRWLRGKGQPADTAVLVAVADAYRRPRVEPFVVLGLLSAGDARLSRTQQHETKLLADPEAGQDGDVERAIHRLAGIFHRTEDTA